MPDIAQGNNAKLILAPGEVYRVTAVGTATVQAAYGAPSGTTTVTAASRDFGPYDAHAKLILTAVSGSVGYQLRDGMSPVLVDDDGRLLTPSGDVVGDSPIGQIYGREKLRRFALAVAAGGKRRVRIPFYIHSFTGFGSDGTTSSGVSNVTAWRSKSIPGAVCRALNASVQGVVGYGVETFAGNGPAAFFTLAGGASISGPYTSTGPGGYALALGSSGHSASFIAAGTAVRVFGYASAVGVVPRYSINGGATQNAPAVTNLPTPIGTTYWYSYDITGLTAGDTVALIGATSGTVAAYAVDPDLKTSAGITLDRISVPGFANMQIISSFLDDTDTAPPGNWISSGANYRLTQAQSVSTRMGFEGGNIVMTDVNDLKMWADTQQGTAWGVTLERQRQHLRNHITYMNSIGLDTLVVCGTIRNPVSVAADSVPYSQFELIEAYKAVTDEFTCAAVLDLTKDFDGANVTERYAAQQASGLIVDTVHPNEAGCDYFGGARIGRSIVNAMV
jgi:hypothetical protein